MKFFLLITSILAISISVSSQVEFGMFAGPQITATHYTIYNIKQKNDLKYGFQAGVGLKVPFDINLFFAPAAFYSLKGYNVTFTQFAFPPDTTAIDNNTTIQTFELAALLQYDLGKKPDHFFIKAGPSLDFQLFGKEKFHLTDGTSVNRNMKFSFGDYGHYSANILTQFGYETGSGLIILHNTAMACQVSTMQMAVRKYVIVFSEFLLANILIEKDCY